MNRRKFLKSITVTAALTQLPLSTIIAKPAAAPLELPMLELLYHGEETMTVSKYVIAFVDGRPEMKKSSISVYDLDYKEPKELDWSKVEYEESGIPRDVRGWPLNMTSI